MQFKFNFNKNAIYIEKQFKIKQYIKASIFNF